MSLWKLLPPLSSLPGVKDTDPVVPSAESAWFWLDEVLDKLKPVSVHGAVHPESQPHGAGNACSHPIHWAGLRLVGCCHGPSYSGSLHSSKWKTHQGCPQAMETNWVVDQILWVTHLNVCGKNWF